MKPLHASALFLNAYTLNGCGHRDAFTLLGPDTGAVRRATSYTTSYSYDPGSASLSDSSRVVVT